MKKKLALAAVIILLFAVAGYGTYAYLTASTTAKNVITAGTVDIKLTDVPKDIEVYKSLGASEKSAYVMPNTDKEGHVVVKNIGKSSCYVRVKLVPTITSASESKTPLATNNMITFLLNNDDWEMDSDKYWRYKGGVKNGTPQNGLLAPGDETSNLLTSIHFSEEMGNEYQNSKIHINVSAQAVQSANNPGSVSSVQGWPSPPPAP